jgi:peptidoglycan/LPS O-acetylase OafA/YrhL
VAGYSLTAFLFAAVVLTTVLRSGSRSVAFLRWKPLTSLGKICYGTYLLHLPIEVIVSKLMQRAGWPLSPESMWFIALKIAATIAAASLSWWLFESRILHLKDRFTSRSHPQQVAEQQLAG